MSERPTLYFDLGSPYAYLAVERAATVLGVQPQLEPVLLGAIFARRGSGSWSQTDERDERIAEIERRAARYGLPAMAWPPGWPGDGLRAMRACTWAKLQGAIDAFATTAFRRTFVEGRAVTSVGALAEIAQLAGLDHERMQRDIELPFVKDALKAATAAAWDAGVRGIPSLRIGSHVVYGDDRLSEAAALLGTGPR
jgi:2-hydroxychromene-2-carboxylate isomerase